jgi:hypothetical protein
LCGAGRGVSPEGNRAKRDGIVVEESSGITDKIKGMDQ